MLSMLHNYDVIIVSTKTELLEQVDQLTNERDELALEVNLIIIHNTMYVTKEFNMYTLNVAHKIGVNIMVFTEW